MRQYGWQRGALIMGVVGLGGCVLGGDPFQEMVGQTRYAVAKGPFGQLLTASLLDPQSQSPKPFSPDQFELLAEVTNDQLSFRYFGQPGVHDCLATPESRANLAAMVGTGRLVGQGYTANVYLVAEPGSYFQPVDKANKTADWFVLLPSCQPGEKPDGGTLFYTFKTVTHEMFHVWAALERDELESVINEREAYREGYCAVMYSPQFQSLNFTMNPEVDLSPDHLAFHSDRGQTEFANEVKAALGTWQITPETLKQQPEALAELCRHRWS